MMPPAPHVDLDTLRLPVAEKTDGELVTFGKSHFQRICDAASAGNVRTHDGERVYVYPHVFDHACYEASTRGRRGISKDQISASRIECLRWIVPLISGRVAESECWRVLDLGCGVHPPPKSRLYVYKLEPYVVWLVGKKRGGFDLRTAYCCGWSDVDRYTKQARGTLKIWPR